MPADLAKQISVARTALRNVWKMHTLPFKDGGWRVCLAVNYLDLLEKLATPKAEYEAICNAVIARYDMIKAEAQKALNGGYKEHLFPTREELERKYGVDIRTEPVLSADDIRVEGLTQAAAEMVRASVEQTVAASIRDATLTICETLRGMVTEFSRKIAEAQKGGKVKFGGLYRCAGEQCKALAQLNITGDPKIAGVIAKVEALLKPSTVNTDDCTGWTGTVAKKRADTLAAEINAAFGDVA